MKDMERKFEHKFATMKAENVENFKKLFTMMATLCQKLNLKECEKLSDNGGTRLRSEKHFNMGTE
ncbi:hypothetical protein TSUD_15390 [Trifolium subterraneum]|uniref:Uncharacterized protein n=1 Tax=Trifolium subterraneum TaxID=3900 RepID=A0A2Z6MM96_TRISU|nr:hypothetical protein TSUD_15390 [Trifolium subterraneum]